MAVIPAVVVSSPFSGTSIVIKWTGVTENDTCAPYVTALHSDRSAIVTGTFGGTSVAIHGANDPAMAAGSFVPLKDQSDNVIAFTAAGCETIVNNTYAVKPVLAGGAGTSVNIWIQANSH